MKFARIAAVIAALFACSVANAQTSGSVTNHAFAVGKGPGVTGYTSLLCGSAQLAVGQTAADPICQTITGDVTISAGGVTAIGAIVVHSSMLNADVFSTAHSWSATQSFPNNSLTLAEFPTIGANTVLGSVAGGTPVALSQAQITAMINLATASLSGALPAWPNNTTTYFRGDGTYATHNFAALGGQATFAQFPTGSLDQVIGYFGATTANAIAINNCSNALTYSTTTHTFGCNSTAGTGTVTSVSCGNGLAGGTITTVGTCSQNAPNFKVRLASSNQSVTSGTTTKVNFDTVDVDTNSWWSSANHNYNPQMAGNYMFCMETSAQGTFTAGATVLEAWISKNGTPGTGTPQLDRFSYAQNAGNTAIPGGCVVVPMNGSTDTVEVDVSLGGTSALVQGLAAPQRTIFSGTRISN